LPFRSVDKSHLTSQNSNKNSSPFIPSDVEQKVFPMIVFFIDADNLSSSAWIEEACSSLEAAKGRIAVRRAY
jgi:hypothetical protein